MKDFPSAGHSLKRSQLSSMAIPLGPISVPAVNHDRSRRIAAIVVGASAGAIEALSKILPVLPRDFPFPVFVVVHLPPDKDSALVDLFRSRCLLEVKEAEDKEPIRGGVVYFAAPNYHLLVEPELLLSLSSDEPELYSRPSIDVLFESAVEAYGSGVLAIVLSGANADGARGIRAVCNADGLGLVQHPETAEASAMPSAALNAHTQARAKTLEEIAQELLRIARRHGDN